MYRVFLVEDDETIAALVMKSLRSWGYEAECARDFREVLGECTAFSPQLVLMDITLPFYNGYYWCTQIRKTSSVPVIFLSSAADNMNIIMAMDMGGDDFVAKPFSLEVLLAKIRAVLRRTYEFGAPAELLTFGGAVLNLEESAVVFGEQKTELTKNEFRILATLMAGKGKIISRTELMRRLWETDCYVDENTLTVNVTRLRKKLESMGLTDFIVTKKGEGYCVSGTDHR